MLTRTFYVVLSLTCLACTSPRKVLKPLHDSQMDVLESLLKSDAELNKVASNKDTFNLQVIYTQIHRDKNNKPSFVDYAFNVDSKYFYPASTVKMPFAFLALEKLNELNKRGVNKYTTMLTDSSFEKEHVIYSTPMAEDCRPSIAHYIKQVFLVSDNEAANRLYEFLGQEYLNTSLRSKGYSSTDIRNRLNVFLTEDQNRHTNRIAFADTSGTILYEQPAQFNRSVFETRDVKFGKGYYKSGSLIHQPFDFSLKNKISLTDLHLILRAALFPTSVSAKQRFNLTEDDYTFLYQYMSSFPRESKFPPYNSSGYQDAYGKFLLYGSQKDTLPGNVRIFNKIGDAYGFLNDIAYVVDFDNKVEFMLSCTLLCNQDGIFNDDKYEYATVGQPFMKRLGEVIYNYEKRRSKKYLPDLSRFVIDYTSQH